MCAIKLAPHVDLDGDRGDSALQSTGKNEAVTMQGNSVAGVPSSSSAVSTPALTFTPASIIGRLAL